MKKTWKMLAACFLLTVIVGTTVLLAACKNDSTKPHTTGSVLTLVGSGAAETYKIVRGDYADETYIGEALRVKNAIKKATGIEIEIDTDYVNRGEEVPTGTKEILVGPTNRPESENAISSLGTGEFYVGLDNGRLVIAGYNHKSTEKAVNYFLEQFLGYNAADDTYAKNTLTVPETLHVKGTYDVPYTVYSIENSVYQKCGFTEGDITRFYSCLQGLYNRDCQTTGKMIYLNYDESDSFWYDYITQDGKFMSGSDKVDITQISQFWDIFMPLIKEHGIITWDPEVPATANVANTICGLDGYLPVRYDISEDSLYTYLTSQGVEVKQDLVGLFTGSGKITGTDINSTGSTKCDAYLWAMEKYMDRCDPGYLGYVLDGYPFVINASSTARDNMVYSIDYLVMKKAFFFDLFYSTNELPNDDPEQKPGTDRKTIMKIFKKAQSRNDGDVIQLIGFPFWWVKYSNYCDPNCSLYPAESEWLFAELASKYNITMEADAAGQQYMTNASVYTYYPLQEHYTNNHTAQDVAFDENKRYFTIYMGDYDSSAWMKYHLMTIWQDEKRGELPLMWGFNPNLAERCPMVWDWIMTTMTPNDYILTGDSGAGYLFPSQLSTTSAEKWVTYCQKKMEQFDIDMVAFVIDGYELMNSKVVNMYKQFAPNGIFYNSDANAVRKIFKNGDFIAMPCQTGLGLDHNADNYEAASSVFDKMGINFAAYRTVLEIPSNILSFVEDYIAYCNAKGDGYTYEYVDPYTMMNLIRESNQATTMR